MERLADECTAAGRARQFQELRGFLTSAGEEVPQAAIAVALGSTEGAVRVALHRLRKRYRALLRDEMMQTLADPSLMEEEMRALVSAVAS